jgi:hypothetical protein
VGCAADEQHATLWTCEVRPARGVATLILRQLAFPWAFHPSDGETDMSKSVDAVLDGWWDRLA